MAKLAVVGQDTSKLIDCSEAIPDPVPPVGKAATFPAGTGPELLQLSCTENIPFPSLATDRKSPQVEREIPIIDAINLSGTIYSHS